MTPEEARELARFARQAMPKSSEAQEIVLRGALEPYPKAEATEVIIAFAEENEFICVPRIKDAIRAAIGEGAAARWKREATDAERRKLEVANEKATADASVTAAIDYCRVLDPATIAELRTQAEVMNPGLRWAGKGKETLTSTVIMCAIYDLVRRRKVGAVA